MGRGILGLVGLAATLAFALPAGLLGVEFLLKGDLFPGVPLVVVAVLMVVLEEYVATPSDVPAAAAEKAASVVASDDEE